MYEENQGNQSHWVRYLQAFFGLAALSQAVVLVAAESGKPWQSFSQSVHLSILLLSTLCFILLWQAGLRLRVASDGLVLRFFPYQWVYRHIHWNEVRRIRILPLAELPKSARFGFPGRDFTHIYLLTSPKYQILNITLVNNTQLYISTQNPRALLDFLQHGVLTLNKSVVAVE